MKGGGCSGLSYTFAWERQPRLGDEVFEGPDGAKIFVDKKSLLYLNGTVLDYDTSLISKGFVFNNPNAKSTCGCGSSFGRVDQAAASLRCGASCNRLDSNDPTPTFRSAGPAAAARPSTRTSARSARRS